MFPSSTILEEEFPSDRDGNEDRRMLRDQRDNRGSNGEKEMLRHFLESGVQTEKGKC